jgi:hypothetical protein
MINHKHQTRLAGEAGQIPNSKLKTFNLTFYIDFKLKISN